jgi:hypothetical protein
MRNNFRENKKGKLLVVLRSGKGKIEAFGEFIVSFEIL